MEAKKITLTFVLDHSIDDAMKKIDLLIKKVQELADISKNSPLLGGGGMSVGNQHAPAGGGSGPIRGAAQAANQGVAGVSGMVNSTVSAVTASTKAGVDALGQLGTAFKSFVSLTGVNLGQFLNTMAKVRGAFSALGGLGGGGARLGQLAAPPSNPIITHTGGFHVPVRPMQLGLPGTGGPLGAVMGPQGAQLALPLGPQQLPISAIAAQIPGIALTNAGYATGAAAGLGGMGAGAALLGGLGFLALAGRAAYGVHGMARENELESLKFGLKSPFYVTSRQAAMGQNWGNSELAMRRGDLAEVASIMAAAQSEQGKYIQSGQYGADRDRLIDMKNPRTAIEAFKNHQFMEYVTTDLAYGAGQLFDAISDGPKTRRLRHFDITRAVETEERIMAEADAQQAEEQKQRQMDPVKMHRLNAIAAGAGGKMAMARAGGLGGGLIKIKGGLGAPHLIPTLLGLQVIQDVKPDRMVDQLEWLEGAAKTKGYSGADVIGMYQQMGATAGRGLMHAATYEMLEAQAGGLANASSLYGLGAQYNGGGTVGAGQFFKGLQGMIGAGGLDVTAASQVFALGQQAMTAGNFGGGGSGLMQALAEATFTGTSGGDMRAARQLQSGFAAFGGVTQGTASNWQKAVNFSGALQGAPGLGGAGKTRLAEMDPATMLDVLKRGDAALPHSLKAVGITAAVVKGQFQYLQKTLLSQFAHSRSDDATPMGQAAAKFIRYGGLGFLKGQSQKQIDEYIADFAPAITWATKDSDDQAMGLARIMAAGAGVMTKPKGKGARSSAKAGSADAQALWMEGRIGQLEAEERGADDPEIRSTIHAQLEAIKVRQKERKQGQASVGGDAKQAAAGVKQALDTFSDAIQALASGQTRARPARTSAAQ